MTPSQLRKILYRVQNILMRMRSSTPGGREWKHPFVAKPCVAPDELIAWERANRVSLPLAYRLFLLEVGNGGKMRGEHSDFVLLPLDLHAVEPELQIPFAVSHLCADEHKVQLEKSERCQLVLYPELSTGTETRIPPGCLKLGYLPNGDDLFLVVTGNLSGSVWYCTISGAAPELNQEGNLVEFVEWFEDILMESKNW